MNYKSGRQKLSLLNRTRINAENADYFLYHSHILKGNQQSVFVHFFQ
jgi:hypothetical protein